MDLGNSTVKTPESETETLTRIQPTKPSTFTNGMLKRHAPLHLYHLSHHPVVVTYKECLKNHAVDGCGEFMPSPTSNPAEPTSLKCAACGCHRNFHRREPEEPLQLLPPDLTRSKLQRSFCRFFYTSVSTEEMEEEERVKEHVILTFIIKIFSLAFRINLNHPNRRSEGEYTAGIRNCDAQQDPISHLNLLYTPFRSMITFWAIFSYKYHV